VEEEATGRRAASQVQALLERVSCSRRFFFSLFFFYDLFNTRMLNAAIYPAEYDTV